MVTMNKFSLKIKAFVTLGLILIGVGSALLAWSCTVEKPIRLGEPAKGDEKIVKIDEVLTSPASYAGKPILIEGIIGAVG